MRLLEFEGKDIFQEFDIPVPESIIINSVKDVSKAIEKCGLPIVLKAQVPIGGRGKAGGIKILESEDEAKRIAQELLGSELKGHKIENLLAEEKLNIENEMYCGIVGDDEKGVPEIIVSSRGGINIETIAEKSPEKIERINVDPRFGLKPYQARNIAKEMDLEKDTFKSFSNVLFKLYEVYESYDAKLSEINPLVKTKSGEIVAADSKIVLDDHSLFRHPEFQQKKSRHIKNPLEREGSEKGVNYVDLDGSIAVMANGAGLAMALMDLISSEGHSPAAFLDTGGGLNEQRMKDSLTLLLKKAEKEKKVKAILVNIRFMISPPDAMVKGFMDALEEKCEIDIPIILVVRGRKRYVERAKELLKDSNISLFTDVEEGVKAATEQPSRS